MTLADYAETFLRDARGRVKPRTLEAYAGALRNHIVPSLGAETPLEAITRGVVRRFVAERLEAGYQARTVLLHAKILRALLNAAAEEELIPGSPLVRLTKLLPRRHSDPREGALSREQLARFLAAADTAHPELALLFRVLGLAGLRLGEGLALRWEDIDLGDRILHVRCAIDWKGRVGTPKSGKPRDVDLCHELATALRARWRRGAPAGWVFPSPSGRPWSRSYLSRVMARALAAVGLSRFTPHDLRRTFATVLADRGASPWDLKELLGHASVSMTQGYIRSRKRHLDAVELLD